MTLFEIENLIFNYGERRVLDIADLHIGKGCITALTGANGSGKSTLMMLLGHLLHPAGGRILFEGTDLNSGTASAMTAFRRRTGVVLQSPYLFKSTVEGNVSYPLRVCGTPKEETARLVKSALSSVGLPGFEMRRCAELSGGETQRVALARSIVMRPDLLLLDEPMANVDASSQAVMERVLLEICRDEGTTVYNVKLFNSAYYLNSEGEIINRYDKIHLVPVSEYIPLRKTFPFIDTLIMTFSRLPYIAELSSGEIMEIGRASCRERV